MRVGVEHAVEVELLAVGVGDELGDGLGVDAGALEGREVRDLDPFHELHDQHAAGRVLPVDLRGTMISSRPAKLAAISSALWPSLMKSSSSGTLCDDLLDDRPEVQVALEAAPGCAGGSGCCRGRCSTISWMPGYCTLTATTRPSLSVALCTWASEAEAIGVSFELREDVVQGALELALDRPLDDGERARRHLVLQAREDVDVLVGDQVGPGADDLAELDEQPLLADGEVVELAGRPGVVGAAARRRPSSSLRLKRCWRTVIAL